MLQLSIGRRTISYSQIKIYLKLYTAVNLKIDKYRSILQTSKNLIRITTRNCICKCILH